MSYPTCSGISCSADCADRDPRLRKDDIKNNSKDDVKSKSNDDSKRTQSNLLSICAADAPQFLSAVYNRGTQARKLQANAAQSGRSMIEMLGVLAIIGVLSVGGIAGYSKAMMKFKTNKTIDQVTQIVSNFRTLYASQKNYESIGETTVWKKAHVFPDEMWNAAGTDVENAFGGNVYVSNAWKKTEGDDKAFRVEFNGIPEEACMELVTYDWGSGSSSGLVAIGIGDITPAFVGCPGKNTSDEIYACPNGTTLSVPMNISVATKVCDHGDDNTIIWKFY